jgi:ATP-dependent Lon protease
VAATAGIKRVMLPARNRRDFDDIPEDIRRNLEFVWLTNLDEAVKPRSSRGRLRRERRRKGS